MTGTLFYCPNILESPVLLEEESYHCVKVLRTQEGEMVTVTDGKGSFYHCELVQAHPKQCIVAIRHRTEAARNRSFSIHIAFAPTKQMDRNEWFLEKGTEVGIDRFTPLLCRYSERKEIKVERLRKIVVSAMKQSMQAYLPEVEAIVPFDAFIKRPFQGRKLIAHCHDLPKEELVQTYRKGENALILIGPEGDFSEKEVAQAIEQGFEPVDIGETRLRSETAALVSMHTIHVINNIQ
ncbi:MAG: 16S rRNA (uracil(1498)-N(3))-methyltransferase [Fermentimonas sp.]|jgi:16S rRNA (uracil1498-N3)-methyltransferase